MRILVIEDDPKIARILVKGLEADHFAVDLSKDGEEGLHLATEIDYDLVVLDWNLPKMDGLTVLKRLRKAGSNKRTLLLTPRREVSDPRNRIPAAAPPHARRPPSSYHSLLCDFSPLLPPFLILKK